MRLGFIGIGKITGALIEGFCTSDLEKAELLLSPRNEQNSRYWAGKYPNVKRGESNQDVLDRSDVIFISVRPADAVAVLEGLSFDKRHTVISVVPLLRYADLARLTSPASVQCRAIPLPPVAHHHCPIPVFNANDTVTALLTHVGKPLGVSNEEQLHVIWSLTGLITPFYDLLGNLSDWTTTHGVDKETANRYIADLFGSLSLVAQQSASPDFNELAAHAATPNGMNERAGREIREAGAHAAYLSSLDHLLERFG